MNRRGYTLVEIMIATALMLVIMYAVTQAFGTIGESIVNARASLEMAEECRGAASRLKADLQGVTVKMIPPRSPGSDEGYFEYVEGPLPPPPPPPPAPPMPADLDSNQLDTTVGDLNDYLMFTMRSDGAPLVGRCFGAGGAITSQVAEVAWFVRGRTLYRRVLLVAPNALLAVPPDPHATPCNPPCITLDNDFYTYNDISVRRDRVTGQLAANTMGDLTMLENRFAHQVYNYDPTANPRWQPSFRYPLPSHPFFYRDLTPPGAIYLTPWRSIAAGGAGLELPTLAECTATDDPLLRNPAAGIPARWRAAGPIRAAAPIDPNKPVVAPGKLDPFSVGTFDAWKNPNPSDLVSPTTGIIKMYHDPDNPQIPQAARVNEDVILNNVLSFDVKAWDPGARIIQIQDTTGAIPTTVLLPGDPGYLPALTQVLTQPQVGNFLYSVVSQGAYVDLGYAATVAPGISWFSGLGNVSANFPVPGVYDTWSTHYEEQNGGAGVNGFDDPTAIAPTGDGVVDDPGEWAFPPPYWAPLKGIQIKIRVYEPSSRQVREVTVVQEFVSK